MRLVCPNCGKAHVVRPEALGGSGRAVRCAACKQTWHVTADGQTDYAAQARAARAMSAASTKQFVENMRSAAERSERPAAPKPVPRRKTAPAQSRRVEPGLAILCGLALFVGGMLAFPTHVVETVPRLAKLYAAFGMPVNVRGLEFGEIKVTHAMESGAPVLLVEGKITNVTSGKIDVPPVRVTLISPTTGPAGTATVKAENVQLDRSGETIFKSRLANPPPDAKDVLVKFSSNGLQSGS